MKKPDSQLVFKIHARGADIKEATRWLSQSVKKCFPKEESPVTVGTQSDTIHISLRVSENEIDPCLSAFSKLLDNASRLKNIFPEGLDLEIARANSTEYVAEAAIIELPGDWKIRLLTEAEEDPRLLPQGTIFIKADWAFGTGRHPSTIGAVTALDYLHRKGTLQGARVLDIGTGTGILAILAARMGAAQVLGLDIDEKILDSARQNIRLNRLSNQIKVSSAPIDTLNLKKQDVIVANLTPSVLFRLLDNLVEKLSRKGFLVLSGYRSGPGLRLRQMLTERGLVQIHYIEDKGWSTEIFSFCLE